MHVFSWDDLKTTSNCSFWTQFGRMHNVFTAKWTQHANDFWRQSRLQVTLSAEQRYLKIHGIVRVSMVSQLRISKLVEFFFPSWKFLTIEPHDFTPCLFSSMGVHSNWKSVFSFEFEEAGMVVPAGHHPSLGPLLLLWHLQIAWLLDLDLLRYPILPRIAKRYQEWSCHLWCNPQVRCQSQWDWTAPTLSRLGIRIPQPAKPGPVGTST